jgi:hypothetical protein
VSTGSSAQAVAGRPPGTQTGGGRAQQEEARLRDAVLGEVLQRGSSVHWADVAGLESAKQVGQRHLGLQTAAQYLLHQML